MKRTISTILTLLATITLTAQNVFVVADKNGNSQLVQSLIFQQENGQFSWDTDGMTDGYQPSRDIKDLLFIARANETFTSGNADDVTAMLEQLSGTDQADAEAVAAALQENPDVEEAFSEDGNNLVVRTNADEGYGFYPMYDMTPLFADDDIDMEESVQKTLAAKGGDPWQTKGQVAIFNFFYDQRGYTTQNTMVTRICEWLKAHGYTPLRFEGENAYGQFTQESLEGLIKEYVNWKAIIIMTHGALFKGKLPYIATRDAATKKDHFYFQNPADGKKYRMIPAATLGDVSQGHLIYLGACEAGKFSKESGLYPNYNSTDIIGWTGNTRIAQAHAALMFYHLLYGQYSYAEILNFLPNSDGTSHVQYSDHFSQHCGLLGWLGNESEMPQYDDNMTASCSMSFVENTSRRTFRVSIQNIQEYPCNVKLRLIDHRLGTTWDLATKKIFNSNYNSFSCTVNDDLADGIYSLEILTGDGEKTIRLDHPVTFIKSASFKELGIETVSEEDVAVPQILSSDGRQIEEIALAAGITQTFTIDSYPGHSLRALTLDAAIADVSVSNGTLTVQGGTEGSTYIGVYDEQNRQMGIAKVTVTAGGTQPTDGQIVLERKYLVHAANNYHYPGVTLYFGNDQSLLLGYYAGDYYDGWSNNIYGVYIMPEKDEGHLDRLYNAWRVADVVHDEWVTEKLVVNLDGRVEYYMNGEYMGERTFEGFRPENAANVTIKMHPYGWWTGHYHYMDDFKITTPLGSWSDDFNDGSLDPNLWLTPSHADGVREEDGIMKMEQIATDVDFHLYTVSLPIRTNEDGELVENGNFSFGNEGFASDYEYVSETGDNTLWEEGKYAIGTSPRNYHCQFIDHGDHTTGYGNMLIANGSPDNSKYVWKKTFDVVKGETYEFSAWFISVSETTPLDKNQIEYVIDGNTETGMYDRTENGWERYHGRYTATESKTIEIKIRSKSPDLGGNDYAIDDICFSTLSD